MISFDDKARTWDDDPVKTARAEAIAAAIRARVPLAPALRGFEFGCGTGLLSFALREALGPITLSDNSSGMLDVLRAKLTARGITDMQVLQLDLLHDPLPDAQFDLAYSAMTLHHIADTDAALARLYTLLAPGAYLCIADLDAEDGSFHGAGFDGHNGFERGELSARARRAGFTAVDFSTVFTLSKGDGAQRRDYPVFLMVARKP